MYGLVERKTTSLEPWSVFHDAGTECDGISGKRVYVIEVQSPSGSRIAMFSISVRQRTQIQNRKPGRKTSARNKILKDHRLKGRVVSEDVLLAYLELVQTSSQER